MFNDMVILKCTLTLSRQNHGMISLAGTLRSDLVVALLIGHLRKGRGSLLQFPIPTLGGHQADRILQNDWLVENQLEIGTYNVQSLTA